MNARLLAAAVVVFGVQVSCGWTQTDTLVTYWMEPIDVVGQRIYVGREVVPLAKDDLSGVRNEIETGGYNLVNLRASHSWDRVRIDLGIENLFDTYYELPTGGAYTGQGTTMQLNAIPWGIAVPGMGRSLYAGVNLTF